MSAHPFPPTRWTVVFAAREDEGEASTKALEELVLAYWKPVYAFLRGKGHPHNEAQDETQAFFANLLKRDFLRNLKPEGGRFRSFLLVSLRHHLIDAHRRASNVKQRAEVPLELAQNVASMDAGAGGVWGGSPEEAFDRAWAEQLVAQAMASLQRRWKKRAQLFAEIRLTIESPGNVAKYSDIAARVGMTAGAVGKAVHDLRQQFIEEIREEVRHTVSDDDDIEEELHYLVRLLRN